MPVEYSIIIACFNEEANIENCLRRLLAVFPEGAEFLVVDGGSDRTGEMVQHLAEQHPSVRYVANENDRGKGHATRTGIAAAQGPIMAQIDADLQFLPEELPQIFQPIVAGEADVVLGSRFCVGAVRRPGSTPFFRTLGNKFASLYASVLFGHRMTDVQAGMKAWTREAAAAIDLQSDNYSYEVEIPVKALKKGLRVVDVPITTDARQGGQTSVNVVTDGIALLWDITRFRLALK